MAVRIEIIQTRTVEEGPLYRVNTKVIYVEDIPPEIFVFKTETKEFSHVAVSHDIYTYPAGFAAAEEESAEFYRLSEVTVEYSVFATAQETASYTKFRVNYLAQEYQSVNEEFVGEETLTYLGD